MYKVGDRIIIKTWEKMAKEGNVNYDGVNHEDYITSNDGYAIVNESMKEFCGKDAVVKSVVGTNGWYNIDIDGGKYCWYDWMIDGLVLWKQSDSPLYFDECTEVKFDAITPEYYNNSEITPFDVIKDWDLDFFLGSAMKYIKRAGNKEGNTRLQDLKKAKKYIEEEIFIEEYDSGTNE